jgi:hypothetical protein
VKAEIATWLLGQAELAFEREAKVTDRIKDRITFLLTVAITPPVGLTAYAPGNFRGDVLDPWVMAFFDLPLIAASGLLLFAAGTILTSLVRRFAYSNVPAPDALIDYVQEDSSSDQVIVETELNLAKSYAQAVALNHRQNEGRLEVLLRAQRLASWAVIIGLAAVPKYINVNRETPAEAQRIIVVSPINVTRTKEMTEKTSSTPAVAPAPTNNQAPAEPVAPPPAPKPSPRPFPPNTVTFDHKIPPPADSTTLIREKK